MGLLYVHAVTHGVLVNGPGRRTTLHLQGCSIGCPGCFSPHTHEHGLLGTGRDVLSVVNELVGPFFDAESDKPEGITISGGEPLQQAAELLQLLRYLNRLNLPRGVGMFSGTTYKQRASIPEWPEIRSLLDFAVLGPYVRGKALYPARSLRSSENQQLVIYNENKVRLEEFQTLPTMEFRITAGNVTVLGFPGEDDVSFGNHQARAD